MAVPGMGHGLGWWPGALSDMMSMSRLQDGGAMLIGKVATVVPGMGHGLGWWPCSSARPWMACSVASEPLLLQRWCVCRLSLERRRGGHGTGCSVGTVAIRIGQAARWWCQVWVTVLGGGRWLSPT